MEQSENRIQALDIPCYLENGKYLELKYCLYTSELRI
jgi:hypothetical protein